MIHATEPDLPPVTVTPETVEEFTQGVRDHFNNPDWSTWRALVLHGICPAGYFTPLSYEALRVYSACGGVSRITSPAEYYRLPAIYVDCCAVIDNKLAEIRKLREANDK